MVTDAAGVQRFVERLQDDPPAVIALWQVPGSSERPMLRGPATEAMALSVGRDRGATEHAIAFHPNVDVLDPLARWLTSDRAPYVVFDDAHHALRWWSDRIGRPFEPARIGCTRIAASLLREGTKPTRDTPSVPDLARSLLGLELPQDALGPPSVASLVAHADAVFETMKRLTALLRERDLVTVYQLETRLLPAVVAMETRGLGVDGAGFERIATGWTVERRDTTDPDRIARLDKLISTYGYWPREYIRGDRIHPRLHPLATDSGRFSCTDPNLQQVPSEHTAPGLRGCFVPPAGMALIIADYAQIELRVAAHLAPCDALRAVFVDGRDPHRATASTLTGKPEHDITAHERQLAKAINFGFLFGMGAPRFRDYARDSYGVDLDEAQAREARRAFLGTYPGIARWHRSVAALGRTDRDVVVRTALGRRKRFRHGKFGFNAALNIPVQGTAAEGFKLAMTALYARLPELGAAGVLCVHDEYLAEAPAAVAHTVRDRVVETMRASMASVVTTVPIEVEARIAASWADKG